MASSQYSFIDIVVLDDIRTRFAAGDTLALLSADLDTVLWANGAGARLFGYGDIEAIIGASPKMGLPAERQISSTPGFPDVGRDRPVAVRITNGFTSRVVNILASSIAMPDGEPALLVAVPAEDTAPSDADNKAGRAIEGFDEDGHFTALVDAAGNIAAASRDFATLDISHDTLLGLIKEVAGAERLAKKRIPAGAARLPAGFARLTDDPALYLLVIVDDRDGSGAIEKDDQESPAAAGQPAAAPPPPANAGKMGKADEAVAPGIDTEAVEAEAAQSPIQASADDATSPSGPVDRWYFHAGEDKRPPNASDSTPEDASPQADTSAVGPAKIELGTAPVKFVWRTGADGRFSSISEEFGAALGKSSADVVGRSFREVAEALGMDLDGDISGLLERRDTWSGRSVLWPVAGTDLRVPVDLAALPVYGRDREFQGFRGFGVARMADAAVVPQAAPEKPDVEPPHQDVPNDPVAEKPALESSTDTPAPDQDDPFRGEVPALTIVPKTERRTSDKIIRLAEHRPASAEGGLSPLERNAFREIGNRLKRESDTRAPEPPAPHAKPTGSPDEVTAGPASPAAEDPKPAIKEAGPTVKEPDDVPTQPAAPASEAVPPDTGMDAADPKGDGAAKGDGSEQADGREAQGAGYAPTGEEEATARNNPPVDEDHTPIAETLPTAAEARDEPALNAATGDEAESDAATPSSPVDRPAALAQPDLYSTILSRLPSPVLIHSGDILHYANEAFLRLTGYASLDAVSEAGGLGELFADPYEGAEDSADDRKLRLKTASGETFPVEALLQSVPWNGGKALMLALRLAETTADRTNADMAASQPAIDTDAEARLAELRTIIDTATDGVVLISPEGNIRSISRPAEALFGFDSADVAGKPFAALFAIESQRAAHDYLQGLSDNGVASVLNDGREVIGREAQGRFIPLFMTIGRLPDQSGFCAVVRDVTQWKRAEEELTQARSQAERSSSQKTEFLARVSHEIRTPLNAIIGFSELMMDEKFGPVGNDRYRDYLRDINRSGNHVLDLVNDLLDISKIEAGEQEMNYEAVSLNDALAETVAMMQPQANRERVIIRSSFPSRLPEVVADLRSVRQIALNLLSNAVHYTQAGGQVIVSTSYEASGEIIMRVRDTGVGMSHAEIEQAMKPFKQVNTLKRPRGDGTGLGLPLTKAMVEANRAKFSISSTPGEGTLVEITFPSTRVLAD